MATKPNEPEIQPFDFKMLKQRGNYMVLIAPDQAELLLEHHNGRNRKIKDSVVGRWTKIMQAGQWDPDASDIKVGTDLNLIDGQHRLLACIRANVPFGTLMRTGLRPETQRRVDIGARRNTADTFKLEGIAWATNTAAAILLRCRYMEGEAAGKTVNSNLRLDMSPDQQLDFLRNHPAHEKWSLTADSMYRIGPGIARTVWFAAIPMFAEVEEEDCRRFCDAFLAGEWGGPGSPIQSLVRYLSQARTPGVPGKRAHNQNERNLLALVKAWNAWRMQEELPRLTVKDNEQLVPVV